MKQACLWGLLSSGSWRQTIGDGNLAIVTQDVEKYRTTYESLNLACRFIGFGNGCTPSWPLSPTSNALHKMGESSKVLIGRTR